MFEEKFALVLKGRILKSSQTPSQKIDCNLQRKDSSIAWTCVSNDCRLLIKSISLVLVDANNKRERPRRAWNDDNDGGRW